MLPTEPPDQALIKGAKYSVPQREEAFSQLVADASSSTGLRKRPLRLCIG